MQQRYGCQESGEDKLRRFVDSMRDELDKSTRTALQATMRIESGIVSMSKSNLHIDPIATRAKMFQHLSALKESLWQVLVIADEFHRP